MQFEFEAGCVVIDPAPERGCEPRRRGVDAARGHEADPAFELVEHGSKVEPGVGRQRAQLGQGIVRFAG